MRINPILNTGYSNNFRSKLINNVERRLDTQKHDNISHKSNKHEPAKFWGALFGSVGFITSAINYMATGGAAINPMLFGYNAISAEPETTSKQNLI